MWEREGGGGVVLAGGGVGVVWFGGNGVKGYRGGGVGRGTVVARVASYDFEIQELVDYSGVAGCAASARGLQSYVKDGKGNLHF